MSVTKRKDSCTFKRENTLDNQERILHLPWVSKTETTPASAASSEVLRRDGLYSALSWSAFSTTREEVSSTISGGVASGGLAVTNLTITGCRPNWLSRETVIDWSEWSRKFPTVTSCLGPPEFQIHAHTYLCPLHPVNESEACGLRMTFVGVVPPGLPVKLVEYSLGLFTSCGHGRVDRCPVRPCHLQHPVVRVADVWLLRESGRPRNSRTNPRAKARWVSLPFIKVPSAQKSSDGTYCSSPQKGDRHGFLVSKHPQVVAPSTEQ